MVEHHVAQTGNISPHSLMKIHLPMEKTGRNCCGSVVMEPALVGDHLVNQGESHILRIGKVPHPHNQEGDIATDIDQA